MSRTTVSFETAYKRLNPIQKQAVDTIEGPVLVLAGPGTGKTQVLTVRIANIIKQTDTDPGSILALTFTDAAAKEMKERLVSLIGKDGYFVKIGTFHAFCADIIGENPERFSRSRGLQVATDLEKIQIVKEILENNSYIQLKPVGDPLFYLSYILGSISDLKREGVTVEKYSDLVITLKEAFEIEKEALKKTALLEREKLVSKNLDLLDIYKKYQQRLSDIGRFDFNDMINWVVEAFESDPDFALEYQEEYQYILADEYQDTNSAQNRLIFALTRHWGEDANLFAVGDPNQCLPGNTHINTKSGIKEIKDVKIGDLVLSAVGKGYTSYIPVTNIFHQKKETKFISIVTESGKYLTATYNHKMFCFIPPREFTNYWYNYLMFKEGVGWRLGITKGLSARLKLESGADKIVGVACQNTEWEARCTETILSLRYQIPTIVFQIRGGKVIQEYIDRVFSEFDTHANALRLADDFGINLNEPHYSREATTLGKGRTKINFLMCSRSYRSKYTKVGFLEHPEVLHEINIQTKNQETLNKLEKLGFKLRNKNIGKGFRKTSTDIKYLYDLAEKLEKELPGFVDIKASIGTNSIQHRSARVMQAGNILVGNYLPVLDGFEIKYEKVISRKDEIREETVYDLEVTPSHNFIANDIVVHNSIFRFQGASKENVLEFQKRFPDHTRITLTENYRSTSTILDSSAGLLGEPALHPTVSYKNMPIKVAKFTTPILEDEFIADSIQKKIKAGRTPRDIAVIVKENKDIENLVNLFKHKKIPYRLQGGVNILVTPLVSQFLKILTVVTNLRGPVDDLDLFTILNYPYFGLDRLSVLKAARYAYKNKKTLADTLLHAPPDIDDKLIEVFGNIVSWNSKSATHTLTDIFQIILQESGLLQHILSLPRPVIELNRFGSLFEDVKAQASAFPGLTLPGYVFNLRIMDENHIRLEEQSLLDNEDAVTLTTAHKSKGLEWRTVYIYRFADTYWGNKSKKQMIKLPPGILREDTEEDDKNAEERRLFYVAITRSKQQLYLTGSTNYHDSSRMIFPSMFLEDLPKENLQKIKTKQYETKAEKILASQLTQSPLPVLHDGEKDYLTEIVNNFKLSPTSLNTFLTCPYKFKLDHLYKIPRAKAPAMCFGTAVHFALENLYLELKNSGKLESKEDLIRDFNASLKKEILSEIDFAPRLEHGRKILSAYYDYYEKEFAPALYTEKKFGDSLSSQIFLDDIPLSGKADRIDLISPVIPSAVEGSPSTKDNRVRFVDYKTGKVRTRGEIEGTTKNSDGGYKRQLIFYHLLAELDKSFEYQIIETELDFIEPKNGELKKERFSITVDEINGLKQIIRDSMVRIRALDFSRTEDLTPCGRCDFRSHCWPDGLPKTAPDNNSEE